MKLPKRTPQHILETSSKKYFKNFLPDEWIADEITDYGIDLLVGIVREGNVTGLEFSVQLKGKTDISDEITAKTTIKKSTINYWNNRLQPVLLVIYCDKEKEAYYKWFNSQNLDLTLDQNSYTISISKDNKLSLLNWDEVYEEVNSIFQSRLHFAQLYSLSIDKLNQEEFSVLWNSYTKADFEKALLYCNEKIQQHENEALWYLIKSHCLYSSYNYKEGFVSLIKAEKIIQSENDPDLMKNLGLFIKNNKAAFLGEMGIAYRDKVYLVKAKELWEGILENNDDSITHYNYANTCSNLKLLDLAEHHYLRSLELEKNNSNGWCNLAEVYLNLEKYDEAQEAYKMALSINNNLLNAEIGIGNCLMLQNKFEEGINYLEKFKDDKNDEIKSHYTDYYYWLAYGYASTNRLKKALSISQEGLEFEPANHRIIGIISRLYSKLWREDNSYLEKAESFFNFRLSIYIDEFLTVKELVDIKTLKGESIESIANFIRANIEFEDAENDKRLVEMFRNQPSF